MIDLEHDPQGEADAAFENADDLSFAGKPLNDFSMTRQRAAIALGLRWKTGKLSPGDVRIITNPEFDARIEAEEERGALLKKRRKSRKEVSRIEELRLFIEERKDAPDALPDYDGIDEDAAIVVYTMTLPDSKCHEIRRLQRDVAVSRFDRWSEANGLSLSGRNLGEAKGIFFSTVMAIRQSESEPVTEGTNGRESPNV